MGSVTLQDDGRWAITYEVASGVETTLPTPAESEAEARRMLHHCEVQAWAVRATGIPLSPDPEPFRALWGWWSSVCLPRYSATWQRAQRHLADRYLLPMAGHLYAGELRPASIRAALAALVLDGTLRPSSANAIRSIGATVVQDAIADGRWPLVANPFRLFRPFRVGKRIWPTLSVDDARRLIVGTSGRRRTLWALALYLGLRRGELWALRREDFDGRRRAVLISRSHERETPKSGDARLLPCVDELWAIVEPYLDGIDAGALLFPGKTGGLLSRTHKFPHDLRADLRRSGVDAPAEIRGHDLRHTFATLATEAGVASDVVRMTLGHAGGVTASYQHLSLEARRRELSRLSIVGCHPTQEQAHAMHT